MTDLVFCWPGKTSAEYASVGITDYLARISHYRSHRVVTSTEERRSKQFSADHRVEREGADILRRLAPFEPLWLCALDPGAKPVSTADFAELLRQKLYEDGRTPVFVVGGPDGLSSTVRKRANRLLGISRFTLPHDMARLVLVEQVYRALTIVHGHPYDR